MTKREKHIRAIAKEINRAHGISKKQALEFARIRVGQDEMVVSIKSITYRDGTVERFKR